MNFPFLQSHIVHRGSISRPADPTFGKPGKIDILLGVDVFVSVFCQGRRCGPTNSPTAIETSFGWVLAGSTQIVAHHAAIGNVNDYMYSHCLYLLFYCAFLVKTLLF